MTAPPYPKAGDVWRSRDKRDEGLTVTVTGVDERNACVHIKRFRNSRVKLRRWTRDYEFVSRSDSNPCSSRYAAKPQNPASGGVLR